MVFVIAFLVEALSAVLAHEGLVARVDARMSVKRRRPIERLSTGVTFVRLFARVNNLMPTKGRRLSESLSAYFTNEGPCSRVYRHMPRQVVVRIEDFAAFAALEALLLCDRGSAGRTFGLTHGGRNALGIGKGTSRR